MSVERVIQIVIIGLLLWRTFPLRQKIIRLEHELAESVKPEAKNHFDDADWLMEAWNDLADSIGELASEAESDGGRSTVTKMRRIEERTIREGITLLEGIRQQEKEKANQ